MIKQPKQLASQAGQTVIEILLATAVVALIMTTIAAGLTVSVKNTSQARYRATASKMAQEGLDLFRRERDRLGWQTFREQLQADGNSGTYCLGAVLPETTQDFIDLTTSQSCDSTGYATGGITFYRTAEFQVVSNDEIALTITVSWIEAEVTRSTELVQSLHRWN